MADFASILNMIRTQGSTEYQNRVPEATRDNIEAVGNPILTYQSTQNEFLTSLVNRIGLVVVRNKIAKNPLSVLKKGTMPLGKDIEEIYTNMASGNKFDPSGATLLSRTTPDTKTIFHTMNRQDQYTATISRQQLQTAFTSYAELNKLLDSIVNSLYSGDNYDEFILTKNLMADAVTDGKITTIECASVVDSATASNFLKVVKTVSGLMQFPSSNYNKYFANKPVGDTGKPVITWTPKEDQILLIRSDVLTAVEIDLLSAVFNLSVAEFQTSKYEVDNFGSATKVMAILCDKSFVNVYDNLYETTEFYNPKGLYWNYYLNHWQTYSFSLLANAVAIVEPTTP